MLPGDGIRVDIAFATAPDDPNPAWVDVTSQTLMSPGIGITRGRSPEGGSVTPGTCSLTLKNDDGRFTAENTASPFYPNVSLYRRLRVSWRDPASLGARNLLSAEAASFEGGTTGGWFDTFLGQEASSTISSSAVRAFAGTKSLLVTWPTTTPAPGTSAAGVFVRLVIGRDYVARVRVWVPTGSPDVRFGEIFGASTSATTSTKDAWVELSIAFTASKTGNFLGIIPTTDTTAGQQVWVDAAQVDEGTVWTAPFTTAAPVDTVDVSDRYVGFVDSWPTAYPGPNLSRADIVATDRLKRIGRRQKLRSLVEQEFLADLPTAYFPCGEPTGSSNAGDVSGRNVAPRLVQVQYGAGGTVSFGAGTGPGTDSLTAPILAPVDASNGRSLRAVGVSPLNPGFVFASDVTAVVVVATSSVSATLIELRDDYGQRLALEVSAAGKLRLVADATSFFGTSAFADSAGSVNNGATRTLALTATSDSVGGSVTKAWLDGVNVATLATGAVFANLPYFSTLEVGGRAGQMLAGTISHVAVYGSLLSSTRIGNYATACSTGFAGERSDQRVARYAGYAGIAAADMSLDVGASTSIAHVDTTGASALDLQQRIAETESGVLFIDRSGLLRFHARTRRYNAVSVDLSSAKFRPDLGTEYNDAEVVNDVTASREGGISYRAISQGSIDQFGDMTDQLDLLTTSDSEVIDAAQWRVQTRAMPRTRVPAVAVDLLSADATTRATALGVEISTRLGLSSLPSQAAAASLDVFVEGYSESITDSSWSLAMNTSAADRGRVWQLGVAGSSELGTTTRLSY